MRGIARAAGLGCALLSVVAAAALPATPDVAGSDSPVASASADFSGDGRITTALLKRKGKSARLEIREGGRRVAGAEVPSPRSRASVLGIETGTLGSAGSLIGTVASAEGKECRSVWRFREGVLSRLPMVAGVKILEDCGPAGEWSYAWEQPRPQSPAVYVRSVSRQTPEGVHQRTEAFVFTGFRLERDPRRSTAAINGVPIPRWFAAELYPKSNLDSLYARFDLSALRSGPRLAIECDGDRGLFAVILRDAAGQLRLPVTASEPRAADPEPGVTLTAADGDRSASVSVSLARGTIPVEVRVSGLGGRFEGVYGPAVRFDEGRLEVYPGAEQELASAALPGAWTDERQKRLEIRVLPGPATVGIGTGEYRVSFERAPERSDFLLLPAAGRGEFWAVALRGPDSFARFAVECGEGASRSEPCRSIGSEEVLRRLGSQVNVR